MSVIPFYVIQSAVVSAPEDAEYVVARSDNDYRYADTESEAEDIAAEMRASASSLSPIEQSVQVIRLPESPRTTLHVFYRRPDGTTVNQYLCVSTVIHRHHLVSYNGSHDSVRVLQTDAPATGELSDSWTRIQSDELPSAVVNQFKQLRFSHAPEFDP